MRIIALDLGIKSLGIAISDENQIIAIPLENFLFEEGDLNAPLIKMDYLLQEYQVEKILLGFPLKTSGEEATITTFIKKFEKSLKEKVKVERVDERFSTQRAKELINTKDKKKLKENKDLVAAWVLLTDYLSF